MRISTVVIPVALALGLSACASTMSSDRYSDQLQRLTDDCRARGGILIPTGQHTGRPQTDNICNISGGASRLTDDG